LVTVIVSGALFKETITLPKSCFSGLILSVAVESEFFASGAIARFAAIATSYATSPLATVSSATNTHTAARAELNVNVKKSPRLS